MCPAHKAQANATTATACAADAPLPDGERGLRSSDDPRWDEAGFARWAEEQRVPWVRLSYLRRVAAEGLSPGPTLAHVPSTDLVRGAPPWRGGAEQQLHIHIHIHVHTHTYTHTCTYIYGAEQELYAVADYSLELRPRAGGGAPRLAPDEQWRPVLDRLLEQQQQHG